MSKPCDLLLKAKNNRPRKAGGERKNFKPVQRNNTWHGPANPIPPQHTVSILRNLGSYPKGQSRLFAKLQTLDRKADDEAEPPRRFICVRGFSNPLF
jgi:hypothetical protein